MKLTVVSVLCVAALSFTRLASASPADAPAAEQLFREGRTAFDRADWTTARARFAESQRLDPAPGTLLNLALAEEKLGDLSHAWEHAKSAADALPKDDDRSKIAVKLAADLDRRVPRLRITLSPDAPADSKVMRDDTEVRAGSLDVALPVDVGTHVIVVSAKGHKPKRFTVSSHEGATDQLVVDVGAKADAPPAHVEPRSPTLGYVLGGVGLAGLALGSVAGVLVLSKKSEVNNHCDASRACDDTAFDAASQGKTWSTVSTVSFVAGGVFTGVGLYLILTSGTSKEPAATVSMSPLGARAVLRFLPTARYSPTDAFPRRAARHRSRTTGTRPQRKVASRFVARRGRYGRRLCGHASEQETRRGEDVAPTSRGRTEAVRALRPRRLSSEFGGPSECRQCSRR